MRFETWDGKERMNSVFSKYLGISGAQSFKVANEIFPFIIKKALGFVPRNDHLYLLSGPQGCGKSRFWSTLLDGFENFYMHFDEIPGLSEGRTENLKWLLSRPIKPLLVGETNLQLDDEESRRLVLLKADKRIDLTGLSEECPQIWAEAFTKTVLLRNYD